jgi:signal transduction histidine kinase
MVTITLVAAIFSLGLTLAVLWVNPTRFSNQAFALVALVQTAWLGCVYRAMQSGDSLAPNKAAELETWFRANAAVISFLPASVWLLKGAIIYQTGSRRRAIFASLPLFALTAICVSLTLSDSFVSSKPSGLLYRGSAYYIYILLEVGVYVICVAQIWRQMNVHTGIRRVELQFLGLNAGAAALLLAGMNALGNYLNIRAFNRASVLLVFAASALTAWALLFHRVVNAREVVLNFARRATFVLALSGVTYAVWKSIHTWVPEPFGLLASIGMCSSIVVWLDRKSRDWFDGIGQRKLAEARKAAIEATAIDLNTDRLIARFEQLLKRDFRTRSTALLFDTRDAFRCSSFSLDKCRPAYAALLELGWATPESLLRRRETEGFRDLQVLFSNHRLGVMITIPVSSPSPTMFVALGAKVDDWPFTFLEVERLQKVTELMDNIVMRSRLVATATERSRIEYLAVMSRGLAHDLKNLITPVSSFLVHMEGRFPATSHEAEIYAAAQSSVREMTGYVRETLSFAERLEPRFEPVDVFNICDTARQVLTSRAATRQIVISVRCEPRALLINADGVLIGRVLANLVSNAIDASAPGQAVVICSSHARPGWVRFDVSDDGCGIPAENLGRIFDPYFTTKRFGDEVRGFGLGLTICQKIVLLHGGKLSAKSEVGRGTTMTVDLPIEQQPAIA